MLAMLAWPDIRPISASLATRPAGWHWTPRPKIPKHSGDIGICPRAPPASAGGAVYRSGVMACQYELTCVARRGNKDDARGGGVVSSPMRSQAIRIIGIDP